MRFAEPVSGSAGEVEELSDHLVGVAAGDRGLDALEQTTRCLAIIDPTVRRAGRRWRPRTSPTPSVERGATSPACSGMAPW